MIVEAEKVLWLGESEEGYLVSPLVLDPSGTLADAYLG